MPYDESYLYDESSETVYSRNVDLWIKRSLIYLNLLRIVLGISSKMPFLFSVNDADSAGYMLSALFPICLLLKEDANSLIINRLIGIKVHGSW